MPHIDTLFDLCTILDRSTQNVQGIASQLETTPRSVTRCLTELRSFGVEIEYDILNREHSQVFLKDPIPIAHEKIRKGKGVRPYPKSSELCEEEQKDLIKLYKLVLEVPRRWPALFFSDKKLREERLRIIIPYGLEHIVKKNPQQVSKKDISKIRLKDVCEKIYNTKTYEILRVVYPWLKPWELRSTTKWKGSKRFQLAAKATRWLVEEILDYEIDMVPERLSKSDFVRHNLGGMLQKVYSNNLFLAVDRAYPGRFNEWELKSTTKWVGKKGRVLAQKAIWAMVRHYGLSPVEIPKKIRKKHFIEYGIYGLLKSPALGFKESVYRAIEFAYPGKYSIEDFPTCKKNLILPH